jgi:hypothetical protein
MSPEEHRILERIAECVEDNNIILRRMQRRARFGTAWKVFYWVVIIALSFGAYVYSKPYLDKALEIWQYDINQIETIKQGIQSFK